MDNILQDVWKRPWRPVSRAGLIGWILFYCAFLLYALTNKSGFLIVDHVNLVVHEGGHLLFGWLGRTPGLWGGTALQWLAPALLACYFFTRRHPTGFAFCLFMLFENFLYTAVYMADARAQALPLVSVGDADAVPHDWAAIFSSLGVLQHDRQIAAVVRGAGWLGMLGTVAWLGMRARDPQATGTPPE